MALFSTLTDNFSAGSVDLAKWDPVSFGSNATVSQISGDLSMVMNNSTGSAFFASVNAYDLTANYALVEWKRADAPFSGYMGLYDASFAGLLFYVRQTTGQLEAQYDDLTFTTVKVIVGTYNSTTHRWLRIREQSGTIYFDYSANGLSWTNATSVPVASQMCNITSANAYLQYSSGATGRTALWDNFNLPVSTSTKTQTGKARITAVTPRTQTGKARITATTTKTQTGKANIGATTSQTQTGKARITAVAQRTQTGKARITNTTLKTQLGKASIRRTTTRTQAGKAAIVYTRQQNQQGRANIGVTTVRTQTGKSRIIMGIDYGTKPNGQITPELLRANSEKPLIPNSAGMSTDSGTFSGTDSKPQMAGIFNT